jgi:hypothetical protein
MQRLNIELLQGPMKLRAKVVVTTRQRLATTRTFALAMGALPSIVLLKFAMSEDRLVALQGCKGLVGTNMGRDKNPMPA